MPRDRDQLTPNEPEDRQHIEENRGLGNKGTGEDLLPGEPGGPPHRFELFSAAFEDGDTMPARFAHDRDNRVPPLEWTDVPDDAAELAIVCEDPDAPNGTFTHWVLSGIDPTSTGITEGEVPAQAVEGRNSFGETGWSGPEPPRGDGPHRYIFTAYASSEPLELDPGSDIGALREALDGHELARGELMATYAR